MKIKRGVLAVVAVAGLMLAGSGAASAQPSSSGSVELPAGINVLDLVFTFFFGPDWMPRDGCPLLVGCPEPFGSSLSDFGSSVLTTPLIGSGSASPDPAP